MEILGTLQQFEMRLFARVFRQTERRMVIPLAKAVSHSGDGYLHALAPLLLWHLDPDGFYLLLLLLLRLLLLQSFTRCKEKRVSFVVVSEVIVWVGRTLVEPNRFVEFFIMT